MDSFDLLAALDKAGLSEAASARQVGRVSGMLHTGNYALNWAISGRLQGGLPLGRIVELYGDPSTGKSYILNRMIAEAQRAGGAAMLDDTEQALSPQWVETALGIDVDALVLLQSNTVEEHFAALEAFVKAVKGQKGPFVVGLDSLALLTTKHEQEVRLDKPSMNRAKQLHAMFRLIGRELSGTQCVYVVTNHVYTGPSNSPWEGRKTSGGNALKYQASVRLDLRTPAKVKDKKTGDIVGVRIRVVVDKNRITAPWKQCEMVIPFTRPISPYSGLVPLLLDTGILEVVGKKLSFEGNPTGLYPYTSDLSRQELVGEKLLDLYPQLLDYADERFAENDVGGHAEDEVEADE